MTDYAVEREMAVGAVRLAAELCGEVQSQISPEVLEKKDRSPVTVADFGSQALVCHSIHEAFPDDPIIAEEDSAVLREAGNEPLLKRVVSNLQRIDPGIDAKQACEMIDFGGASDYADRYWTLDPIDGTKGFIRKEQYAISLALVVNGEIVVAALGCPNLPMFPGAEAPRGVVFSAERGKGTTVSGLQLDDDKAQAVSVSTTTDPADARLCESVESGHSSHSESAAIAQRLNITHPPVRLDSQAKYATVARGEADIYLRLPTRKDYVERIWDHAGGVLVVEEAGGTVTDVLGKPLAFTHGAGLEKNRGVIVTNGRLHDQVLAVVRDMGIGQD